MFGKKKNIIINKFILNDVQGSLKSDLWASCAQRISEDHKTNYPQQYFAPKHN